MLNVPLIYFDSFPWTS